MILHSRGQNTDRHVWVKKCQTKISEGQNQDVQRPRKKLFQCQINNKLVVKKSFNINIIMLVVLFFNNNKYNKDFCHEQWHNRVYTNELIND